VNSSAINSKLMTKNAVEKLSKKYR